MTRETSLPLVLIAAVGRNGVIGAGNALPWRLPGDLRHFRAMTMGRPVLMGRKTFQSLPGPLPGRRIIVVSRAAGLAAPGARIAGSVAEALAIGEAEGRAMGAPDVIVAGGGELYAALIGLAHRLHITAVDLAPEGDTRFPAIEPGVWRETAREEAVQSPGDDAPYSFITYERR